MPVTTAVAAVVTAVAAVGTGTYEAIAQNQAAQHAKGAAEALASQQRDQLNGEQAAAEALTAHEAVGGQTFGMSDTANAAATGLGFGSGGTGLGGTAPKPNLTGG